MGFGLTAEVRLRRQQNYREDDERAALEWMEAVLDDDLFADVRGEASSVKFTRRLFVGELL